MPFLSPKAKSFAIAVTGGHAALFGYLTWTGHEQFYREVLMPLGRTFIPDGEIGHNLMVKACHYGLVPRCSYQSKRLVLRVFSNVADFFVINVSSPNTPGLRVHQQRDKLETLLEAVLKERDSLPKRTPVLLKIAPDLSLQDKQSIAEVALAKKLDGLIISNTTTTRPDTLTGPHQTEQGGLSGEPLRELALETLQAMYRLTQGKILIVGLGGISTGADAYERIRSGASVVQIYTSFSQDGPPVVRRIERELDELLQRDGLACVQEAVGIDNTSTPSLAEKKIPQTFLAK
ncbi:putative Dihydroorotate dehydrogenase (quinone), mitochondrial [Hypsibius exemplaris]|uniref:Dihydroorotate dehydrogenase (quinone), mitochondrial n=1 Tax=Hypsibius exemplaris TaxID=2072580 RepID=A0A9X6NI24_HYPEX|nr:putative Dihydroorotate dehydrogenase (quinone), mitochondrial [Hypsibius exemplaris]